MPKPPPAAPYKRAKAAPPPADEAASEIGPPAQERPLAWYKTILDNLPFPTSVFDLERRWIYLNPSAARALGGKVADCLGRPYAEGWKNYRDSGELDDSDDVNIRNFTRYITDSKKVFSGYSALLEDERGQGIGFIETLIDITQAHEAEERTRLMLDATPLACCFFNQQGTIVDCNLEAATLCGFTSKRHFLERFFKIMPPYLSDGQVTSWALMENVRQAFKNGRAFMSEMRLRAADGTEIPGEILFRRLEWREEYIVLGYFRDLRTLKTAQANLESERLLLRDILDGCPIPFAIIADGLFRFATPFARTNLGADIGAPVGRLKIDPRELVHLRREMKSRRAVNWRPLKIHRSDGTVSENLLNAYTAEFEGRPAVMAWLADVTSLRQKERELSVARDQAEASTRAKSAFLANVSHEIRTPMNAIIGLTNLLLETDLSGQQLELVEKTGSAAKSLLYMINDILDFSKLESGRLELTAQEFYLQNVLKNALDLVSVKAEEKGLELMVMASPESPVGLVGDEYRLLQILNNLLGNAVKFTDKGEVSLTVDVAEEKKEEVTLLFLIRDTGIGLDRRKFENLFDPFTQADVSFTRHYGGTGLGLAISKSLVEIMGGKIWCESEPGRGSTFGFTARFGRHSHEERFISDRRDFSGFSALVVDDNEMARNILYKYLRAFGFQVAAASAGEEALTRLNQERALGRRFDLVTMDLLMPGLDGLETARRLTAPLPPAERPVIVMTTAYAQVDVVKAAAEAGIKTVLEKPISPDSLRNVLTVLFEGIRPGVAASAGPGPDTTTLAAAEKKKKLAKAAKGQDTADLVRHLAGARILLVEDNEVNQMVATKILKRAGFNVSVANNGQVALDMAAQSQYDLVLMDIQMPVMDGLTAAREIRRLEGGAVLPIVALTAHAMPEDRAKSLDAGMNDHITKPLAVDELFRCLAKWLKTVNGRAVDPPGGGG